MALYTIYNAPMPTVASIAAGGVASGTSIKTLLQVKPFNVCRIVEWGMSFDGFAAVQPVIAELIDTGTIFGTVTASADADVMKVDGAEGAVASVAGLTLGTTATGYTCTSEGSIVATKVFDGQLLPPTGPYLKQFPLGREPKLIIGNAVRIRIKAAATVNVICYMTLEF